MFVKSDYLQIIKGLFQLSHVETDEQIEISALMKEENSEDFGRRLMLSETAHVMLENNNGILWGCKHYSQKFPPKMKVALIYFR